MKTVNTTKNKIDTEKILNYLVITLGFTIPISVVGSNIVLAIILLLWIIDGNFYKKYKIIKNNKIIYPFIIFFMVNVAGLLWTQDMKWGLHIVSKEWRMLIPLILITIVKKEYIKYYISSFLFAILLSEIISYMIFFKIIPPFLSATVYDPTPFVSHITYNPFLAFGIYLLLYFLIFEKNKDVLRNIISLFFILSMSVNMFVTGGRAGQVGYFIMITLIIIQYFKEKIFKATILLSILLPLTFYLAYNYSSIFRDRFDLSISNIKNYNKNVNTSVSLRINFARNSWEIIKQHPITGVGTGDFPSEYEKINQQLSPNMKITVQPHNMYILEMTQTGILGLLSLLYILYTQIKISFKKNKFYQIEQALPVLFAVIMLSDTYLLGHYTSLMFVYFSSFLYKDYNNEYQ